MSEFIPILFVLTIFAVVFFFIRFLAAKQNSKSDLIEQKLDRIIALLEKDIKE